MYLVMYSHRIAGDFKVACSRFDRTLPDGSTPSDPDA